MSESNLSVGLNPQRSPFMHGLAEIVSHYCGYGNRTLSELSQDRARFVRSIIASGLRQVYFPIPTAITPNGYEWSFLRASGTLYAWPTTTGEVSASSLVSGTPTRTLITVDDDELYNTMVGFNLVFSTSGTSYQILEIIGSEPSTQCRVLGDATGEADATYTITPSGIYRLPDDFGGFDGELYFDRQQDAWNGDGIRTIGDAKMAQRRQQGAVYGRPTFAAHRPLGQVPEEKGGTRFECLLWPVPDRLYEIGYRYIPLPDMVTESQPFPLGGMMMSEVVIASCLAVAEFRKTDVKGHKYADFMEKLTAAISHDKRIKSPDSLGYNGDRSDEMYGGSLTRDRISGLVEYLG